MWHLMCLSRESLNHPCFPDPPGALSISCQLPNHTHVRCSWADKVKTFLPAVYSASLRWEWVTASYEGLHALNIARPVYPASTSQQLFSIFFFLRGNRPEWTPCIVDAIHKHCDVHHLAYWQTIHTLRVTETNSLGSNTTLARFKFSELCKFTHVNLLLVVSHGFDY